MLTNADLKFAPAITSKSRSLPVTQSSVHQILGSPDRPARQTAWNNYMDRHLEFKNTLASNLTTSIKANVFGARARKHSSSLEASLFENNVPPVVFHNLIEVFKSNLPTWHKYWEIRKRALGLDSLHVYDITAPLSQNPPRVPYTQAVEWIANGMQPLGDDYVAALRRG